MAGIEDPCCFRATMAPRLFGEIEGDLATARSDEIGADALMTDRQYESLAEFRYALRVFLRFSETAARAVGLTPAQHQLLLAVRGWPGDRRPAVGEIAERLQSTPQATLELARRAAEAGLVRLEESSEDRRRQLLSITAEGDVRLDALSTQHRDELRRFRGEMNAILSELE